MRTLYGLILLFLASQLSGAEPKYPASEIPADLKTASNAIVRLEEEKLTIMENGSIERRILSAITVLDENGEDEAYFYGHYDKYTRLRSVVGRVYDADGEHVETYRGDDIADVSMIGSSSLFDDSRVKIIHAEHHTFPYTVEYTAVYVLKSFLDIPDWRIYPDYNVAIENASFSVISPGMDDFRYLMRNMDLLPEIEETREGVVHTWRVKNLPPVLDESLSGSLRDVSPVLFIGPIDFNYGGTTGTMSSWKEFGDWIWSLSTDKRDLTPEEISHVRGLVAGTEDPAEKISILYEYMQDKVRYVNISLGIGGFEPIDALRVSELGYGDCKALSNYMCALLAAVDMDSRYTLVMAGKSPPEFIEGFPSQQFNHAIVAVPLAEDTVWLECTSQRLPAGYLGSFTDNRDVLMVSAEGGELSRTPKFAPEDNARTIQTICDLDENLGAVVEYSKEYRGSNFGIMQSFINNNDAEEQKRSIQNDMRLSGFTVNDFHYDIQTGSEKVVVEKASIFVNQMVSPEGEYISFQPGAFSEELGLPGRSRNRKLPVVIRRGFVYQDSVSYILPGNLNVHLLPDPVFIETEFGKFESRVEPGEEGLNYYRYLVLYDGTYAPEQFRSLYSFLRKVNAADKREVLLIRN